MFNELRDLINLLEARCTADMRPAGSLTADPQPLEKKSLMIVHDVQLVINACKDGAHFFVCDRDWSLSMLMENLSQFLKSSYVLGELDRCGWMLYTNGQSHLSFASDCNIDVQERSNIAQWQPVVDILCMIKPYLKQQAFDLVGPNTLPNNIDAILERVTGLVINHPLREHDDTHLIYNPDAVEKCA